MVAYIYVANPSGRVGPFGKLRLENMAELKEKGMVEITTFKTDETYKSCYIVLDEISTR